MGKDPGQFLFIKSVRLHADFHCCLRPSSRGKSLSLTWLRIQPLVPASVLPVVNQLPGMASSDLEKRTPLIDVRDETPQPRRSPARRRLIICLAVFVVSLVAFSIGHSGICGRTPITSAPQQGALTWVDKGVNGAVAGDGRGNTLLATKRQETGVSSVPAAAPTVLECFQVAQPVLMPGGVTYSPPASGDGSSAGSEEERPPPTESCTVVLMQHTFGWSYDKPFIGKFGRHGLPGCDTQSVAVP